MTFSTLMKALPREWLKAITSRREKKHSVSVWRLMKCVYSDDDDVQDVMPLVMVWWRLWKHCVRGWPLKVTLFSDTAIVCVVTPVLYSRLAIVGAFEKLFIVKLYWYSRGPIVIVDHCWLRYCSVMEAESITVWWYSWLLLRPLLCEYCVDLVFKLLMMTWLIHSFIIVYSPDLHCCPIVLRWYCW